jgi:molecular chaperone GrpE
LKEDIKKEEKVSVNEKEIKKDKKNNHHEKCMEEIKKFAEENKKLIEEKNALSDKILRLNAEMQNMNRRFNEEKANIYKYDGEKLIKEILPIIDNFERSLKSMETSESVQPVVEGVNLIYQQGRLNRLQQCQVNQVVGGCRQIKYVDK